MKPRRRKLSSDGFSEKYVANISKVMGSSADAELPIDWPEKSILDVGGVIGLLARFGKTYKYYREPPVKGVMGQCFHQAWELSTSCGLKYCEGYAVYGPVPIPLAHAWCEDNDGYVVDPTWLYANDRQPSCYFGVPLNREFVCKVLLETGYYGIFENLWCAKSKMSPVKDILDKDYLKVVSNRYVQKNGAGTN